VDQHRTGEWAKRETLEGGRFVEVKAPAKGHWAVAIVSEKKVRLVPPREPIAGKRIPPRVYSDHPLGFPEIGETLDRPPGLPTGGSPLRQVLQYTSFPASSSVTGASKLLFATAVKIKRTTRFHVF